jgi:phosphoglycolate phosphatase
MEMLKNYDSIIFDLDGTLWNATENIMNAWNEILEKHPEVNRQKLKMSEMRACMGLVMYDIAEKLMPDLEKKSRNLLMDEMCAHENEYLAQHGGTLFPDLEKTLGKLQEKYKLYIVSNCQDGYIEAFLSAHRLSKYFSDTECWGRTRKTKGESNKILIERNGLKNPVYVGDTVKDAQSAKDADIDFIYAAYGFGEVDSSTYVAKIDNFSDLTRIL